MIWCSIECEDGEVLWEGEFANSPGCGDLMQFGGTRYKVHRRLWGHHVGKAGATDWLITLYVEKQG